MRYRICNNLWFEIFRNPNETVKHYFHVVVIPDSPSGREWFRSSQTQEQLTQIFRDFLQSFEEVLGPNTL